MQVEGGTLRIFGFQITCLEIKESLGGLERWDPALTAGDTWALGVARGMARETPHLSLQSPDPLGGLWAPLWVSVPQPGVWDLCEQDVCS